MEHLTLTMARIWQALTAPRVRDERGDVPSCSVRKPGVLG